MSTTSTFYLTLFCFVVFPLGVQGQSFTDRSHLLDDQDEALHSSWGASIADLDGNGLPDIYEPGMLYLQQADGTFVSSLPEMGIEFQLTLQGSLPQPVWGRRIFGAVMADVDDDGFSEMVVMDLTADSSHFYKGLHGLRLEEVGPDVGITFKGLGQGTVFGDFNGDGPLDLFFGEEKGHNQLFIGDGTGSFLETTLLAGVDSSVHTYGVAAADYDGDGDLDIFIGACSQQNAAESINLLFRNNGDGTFDEVGHAAGIDDDLAAWAVSWLDYDLDGLLDVYVANMFVPDGRAGWNKLYRNRGDGTFEDVAGSAGVAGDSLSLSFGASIGDLNNDGLQDIYVANRVAPPNIYMNNGDGTFTDRFAQSGVSDAFDNMSVAIADLNADGWLDVYTGADQTPYSRIFMNNGGSNGYLNVNLVQAGSNRKAIGARIELWDDGSRQVREIRSGDGFSSQNMAHSAHFGTGTDLEADSIVVRWPDGSKNRWTNVASNQHLWLEKGGGFNRPPEPFEAYIVGTLTKLANENTDAQVLWQPSTDPEGETITYTVSVRDATGIIVHSSAPLVAEEYQFEIPDPPMLPLEFTVAATDGLHVRRSVNIGVAGILGSATETSLVPRSFSIEGIFPNPASDYLEIQLDARQRGSFDWEIFDVTGKRVRRETGLVLLPGSSTQSVDISGLSAGVYLIRLRSSLSVSSRNFVVIR